ncbi:GNAT family N-acetyltransferase [Bacillus sp. AFS055030]|uniref:GNAT family N-acetyltransferase n=1 Tax=Bacillus sp. AFS055030 TaxID=2033507 RepID=UPI000BFB5533|nr:GNAT family N-acetyltransferase [Bacillus sp. AFS055030]PGL73272.1 GNAT family N-acetyltransferase [Bacillus sp. AFS055030]
MSNSLLPTNTVSLIFYNNQYEDQLKNYFLADEHLKFTGLPIDNIEKCAIEADRHAILILSNNDVAGFFVLHGWDGVRQYSDNKNAILLRAFSVDTNFQGKGIAKQSLHLLPSFVKENFPERDEIILGVNHKNIAAQHVYLTSGFIDKGNRVMGRKGELFIMHMDLV